MKGKQSNTRVRRDQGRDWREICKDLLQETQPERVDQLLVELRDVLDERARNKTDA